MSLSLSILQETVETSAGGVEGTLLLVRSTVLDEGSPIFVDHCQKEFVDGVFARRGIPVQVSDDFAAASPQTITVHARVLRDSPRLSRCSRIRQRPLMKSGFYNDVLMAIVMRSISS